MLKKSLLLVFVFAGIVNLYPSTGGFAEVKCPLCNTDITYWRQASYTIFTHGLDLKPVGAAVIPQPIPKCDNCGFAFIKDYFKKDEEIQMLKNFYLNKNIFSKKEGLPKYYCFAFSLELLGGKNQEDMIYFYVCSVWEYSFKKNAVDFSNNVSKFLMKKAIEKINGLDSKSEDYNDLQLVKLDFLRRLSLFNEAKELIDAIKNNEELYQGITPGLIAYQIELIKQKDTNEHYLKDIKGIEDFEDEDYDDDDYDESDESDEEWWM